MTDDTAVTCPTCGTVSYLETLDRSASSFCRVCDFPLFWTRSRLAGAGEGVGDTGLRRLPGTAGRVSLVMIPCPQCTEPNPITARICIRCGADLHPVPPPPPPAPVPTPPPPPPPPPPAPKRRIWLWVLLAFLAACAIAGIVVISIWY